MSSMYMEAGSLARAGSRLLYVLLRMESYKAESSRSGGLRWSGLSGVMSSSLNQCIKADESASSIWHLC